MRLLERLAAGLATAFVLLAAGTVWAYPALGAAACPSCYGFERIAPGLLVERSMASPERERLSAEVGRASARVARRLAESARRYALVVCASDECDARLGGRGARATTYSTPFGSAVRVSPRGANETILAHELAHVRIHALVGLRRQITGDLPAWFDEGLAVIVSGDERYVREGRATECSEAALPTSPFEWAPASGRDPMLYAHAACRVLAWLDANGGWGGLLAALGNGRELP